MTAAVIRWEDPPPPADTQPIDHVRVAADLRERPRRWALIAEHAHPSVASQIKRAERPAYRPSGAFDALARDVGGSYAIYARYLGEPS